MIVASRSGGKSAVQGASRIFRATLRVRRFAGETGLRLIAVWVLLTIFCAQPTLAQNWQQQQMLQQQRQMEMQRQQQQRQMEMQRQQQMRQQQEMLRQQQARQQQQMRQQQQAMQGSQQRGMAQQRPIQRYQGPTRTATQQQWQRPTQQRTQQAQSASRWNNQRQQAIASSTRSTVPRAAPAQQSTVTRWANRAASYLRNTFNAQRGVTVKNRPAQTAAAVRTTRPPNRTEIQRGFRGRFVGNRAVVTVNGRTYTVPRSMVQGQGNRASSQRVAAAGSRNGSATRRFVLSGGRSNGGRSSISNGGSGGSGGVSARPVSNILHGAQLAEHLRQLEKYGAQGFKALGNGRFRYYGNVTPAKRRGEMAGARLVREWDPKTGNSRTWYETLDHAGKVRSVAPKPSTNAQNHLIFDKDGNYIGRRQ